MFRAPSTPPRQSLSQPRISLSPVFNSRRNLDPDYFYPQTPSPVKSQNSNSPVNITNLLATVMEDSLLANPSQTDSLASLSQNENLQLASQSQNEDF